MGRALLRRGAASTLQRTETTVSATSLQGAETVPVSATGWPTPAVGPAAAETICGAQSALACTVCETGALW